MSASFPTAAYQRLVHTVYKPVYLTKLAEFGIVPRNDEEEQSLLEMAGMVRTAAEKRQTKQAAVSQSPILEVSDAVKRLLAEEGVVSLPTSRERQIKAAAAQACQDPAIRDAAVAFYEYTQG